MAMEILQALCRVDAWTKYPVEQGICQPFVDNLLLKVVRERNCSVAFKSCLIRKRWKLDSLKVGNLGITHHVMVVEDCSEFVCCHMVAQPTMRGLSKSREICQHVVKGKARQWFNVRASGVQSVVWVEMGPEEWLEAFDPCWNSRKVVLNVAAMQKVRAVKPNESWEKVADETAGLVHSSALGAKLFTFAARAIAASNAKSRDRRVERN
eukprot:1692945-Amphidinium_carterae.1